MTDDDNVTPMPPRGEGASTGLYTEEQMNGLKWNVESLNRRANALQRIVEAQASALQLLSDLIGDKWPR